MADETKQSLMPQRECDWRSLCIVEIAAENPSVSEYVRHWEGRTEAAEARVRVLEEALRTIDKWCNGENQVGDGEDAEDALVYIANVVRAALAPPAGTPQEKGKGSEGRG